MGQVLSSCQIVTSKGQQALQSHAWTEDLIQDFFQLMLGIQFSVSLLSTTQCVLF